MSCQNNLKQMGLAFTNYDNTYGKLPAALIHSGRYNNPNNRKYQGPEVDLSTDSSYMVYNHSGFVALLPFIEQDNLFKQYNYRARASGSSPYGLPVAAQSSSNDAVAAVSIKIYTCPGDENPAPVESQQPGTTSYFYEMVSARRSNYLFSTGGTTDYDGDWSSVPKYYRGAFGNNGAIAINRVGDGTSNTIAIGESTQQMKAYTTVFGPYWGTGTHTAVHGWGVWNGTQPNYPYGPCGTVQNRSCPYAWGFGSLHSGGTNFVFLDGSVKLLRDGITLSVWQALCTPEGGEVISGDY